MKATKRELKFAEEYFTEVHHTTLNPEGPGAVRIHLVPPRIEGDEIESSIVIINGQDVIPVNYAWSVLLAEFINEVNKYHGREVSDEDVEYSSFHPQAAFKKSSLEMRVTSTPLL